MFIAERMAMASPTTVGSFTMASVARMATWGWLTIGALTRAPNEPVLFRVNVPPWTSSSDSLPSRPWR